MCCNVWGAALEYMQYISADECVVMYWGGSESVSKEGTQYGSADEVSVYYKAPCKFKTVYHDIRSSAVAMSYDICK